MGPQSGDSMKKVGSGKLAKAGPLVKSFSSRPRKLMKNLPMAFSMVSAKPIVLVEGCLCGLLDY